MSKVTYKIAKYAEGTVSLRFVYGRCDLTQKDALCLVAEVTYHTVLKLSIDHLNRLVQEKKLLEYKERDPAIFNDQKLVELIPFRASFDFGKCPLSKTTGLCIRIRSIDDVLISLAALNFVVEKRGYKNMSREDHIHNGGCELTPTEKKDLYKIGTGGAGGFGRDGEARFIYGKCHITGSFGLCVRMDTSEGEYGGMNISLNHLNFLAQARGLVNKTRGLGL